MKKILFSIVLMAAGFSTRAVAQDSPIFPKGEKAVPVHNTGDVWLHELSGADSVFNYNIAVATFAPGAKLDWHTHPAGQVLLITDGTGFYQEVGKPKQTVRKGEVIKCQPGVEHWHGATPESGFTYLATTPTQKGKTIWGRRVTDAEYLQPVAETSNKTSAEQEIIALSKNKWRWMQEFKTDSLAGLFHEEAVFVHMGATFSKAQELDVIKSKGIVYKHAEIQETSVRVIDQTAILLNKIRLTAIVGGNEVVNPFNVTEVYVRQGEAWVLASLSFTKLLVPDK